jgi:hypothetical protein
MLLAFARPRGGDLDSAERQLLEAHLASCPACAALAERERQFDERVGQAMRNISIPDGLKNRLLTKLGNERNSVYRLVLVRTCLKAAIVMIGFGLVWFAVNGGKKPVDLSRYETLALSKDPNVLLGQLREEANLPNLQFPNELLNDWDFNLLISQHVELIEGEKVPTLIFQKGDTRAVVRLWRRDKVNSDTFTQNYPETKRLLEVQNNKDYIAMVVIEGGSYKYSNFLKPGRSATTS